MNLVSFQIVKFRQGPLHKIPVEFSYLASDVFLSKQVFSFIVEDNMHFLGTRSTDIRAYDKNLLNGK